MSVWNEPHYRSEPLIILTEHLDERLITSKKLKNPCDFTVGDFGDFDSPAPAGHFWSSIKNNPEDIANVAYKFGQRESTPFSLLFESLPSMKCGIEAVYTMYSKIWTGKFSLKREFNAAEMRNFGEKFLKAFGPASYSSPSSWETLAETAFLKWDDADRNSPLFWFQQAEAVRHFAVIQGMMSIKKAYEKAEDKGRAIPPIRDVYVFGSKSGAKGWKAYKFKSMSIFAFKPKLTDSDDEVACLLINKDLNRLSQLLESTGKVFHYFQNYADRENVLSKTMVDAASEIIDLMVGAFESTTADEKNSICRSMDIAQFTYLASLAGPLSARSLAAQETKGHDGLYDRVFPLDKLVGILKRFKPREALELASIRKILPVPDFCIYSAMNSNRKMHHAPFEMLDSSYKGATREDFILYWKWSMLRNYYDKHKAMPGKLKKKLKVRAWHRYYPECDARRVPYKEVEDIEWEGTFLYQEYDYAEHELRKDKTTAPTRLSMSATSEDLKEMPIYERNQIAKLILDPTMASLKSLREEVLSGNESFDYVHLTALKPESKKEGGRMFYMANDQQRVLMSEKEANVAEYLVHKAGNSSGVSDADLAKQMANIAAPGMGEARRVKISFDLEKWSPRQNPWLKETAYGIWAHAFGKEHLLRLSKVQKGSRVAFIKFNVHHEYVLPGNDLEGYDAKTNTAMHIEVMSYAINICRSNGLLKKGATLLALIDDGGANLDFDVNATDAEVKAVVDCIEDIYHMVGLRISWDKTFVSEDLFQYLNEVYYKGYKVTPGLKAFLRVGKALEVPAPTITDEIDAINGELQGAIKAGASYQMCYVDYAWEVYKILKRWSRYRGEINEAHVLMCLLPVAFGGLGVRSMMQLAFNQSFNPIVSSLGNTKAFVHSYPKNKQAVNTILNQGMRAMKEDAFVRSPASIRVVSKTLNVQRFSSKMRDWIMEEAKSPFVASLVASTVTDAEVRILAECKRAPEITAVGLKNINDMRPSVCVDKVVSKLQRSQTAAALIGARQAIRIALANRFEAARLIVNFGKLVPASSLYFIK